MSKNHDFSEALFRLKEGFPQQRMGWNGKGMYVYLVHGSKFTTPRPPLDQFYAPGTEIEYLPHIDMKTADGKHVPWLASQTDILAEDWQDYEPAPF